VKADGCVFGGHSAALNYGDCFAYALAKASDAPLLRLMLTIMGGIAEFERGLIRASARMRARRVIWRHVPTIGFAGASREDPDSAQASRIRF
jgi:DNA invertase Pin-like site-specific DNA recombinase